MSPNTGSGIRSFVRSHERFGLADLRDTTDRRNTKRRLGNGIEFFDMAPILSAKSEKILGDLGEQMKHYAMTHPAVYSFNRQSIILSLPNFV